MERCPGSARDIDHLAHGIEQSIRFVAHMHRHRRLEPRRFARQFDQLLCVSIHAGEVDEPERERACACLERLPDLVPHGLQFGGARRAPGTADHIVAHRTVTHRGYQRRRRSRRGQGIEVLRHARPAPVGRPRSLQRTQVRPPLFDPRRGDGCRCESIRVDQLGGEALRDLRCQDGVVERAQCGVRMHVDETGTQHQPGCIDHLPRTFRLDARRDRGDAPGSNADIENARWLITGIDVGTSNQ